VKHRTAFLLCALLTLVALAPRVPVGSAVQSTLDIGLGFGPSSVQPISQGVPIFTQGDNVWVGTYYNATIDVELLRPDGSPATGEVLVEPGQLFQLYHFDQNASSGPWMLSVATSTGIQSVTVFVVSPDASLSPVYQGARLQGSILNQTFQLPGTDAYNIQVCTAGQTYGHSYGFGLLGGLNGTVTVSLTPNSTQFTATGIRSPISTWVELFAQYSYLLQGDTSSQNLLVASSPVVTISPPGVIQPVALNQDMPLRQGRYDVRTYVRTTAGPLALHDTEFLRTSDGSWVSLAGCSAMANVYRGEFSLTTNLDSANTTWPRQLFTMYTMTGQESYVVSAIPGSEAAVHFRSFPDEGTLTGVAITPSAPGLLPSDWDSANSSVYLLTSGLSGSVSFNLSFGGVINETFNVAIGATYFSKSISVDAGSLSVSATQGGVAFRNATITVAAPDSPPVAIKQSTSGSISLLLPPDNYTVSATYSGTTVTKSVTLTPGHVSTLTLELGKTAVPTTLYLLAGVGVAGVIANVLVWRQYLVRRKVYG